MSPYHGFIHISARLCRTSLRLGASHLLKPDPPNSAAFHATYRFTHYSSKVPRPPALTPPVNQARADSKKNASTLTEVFGQPGCKYSIQKVLQEKESPTRRVYLACAEDHKWVVKDISPSNFENLQNIYHELRGCPYIRHLHDTVQEQSLFVFNYCTGHLLGLVHEDLSIALTKRVLKDALRGLAELHDRNFVHNDVKANNIMTDWEESRDGINVSHVQLTDIEDAAHLPLGFNIRGLQVGNHMWRSPEANMRGPVNTPSDMFSFGIACIYAITKRVILAVGEDEIGEGEELLGHVLERQISYFADWDGLVAMFKHLGDSPWCEILNVLAGGFNETNPRRPFSRWKDIDADFKDLVCGMTNFDPAKRLTAKEALAHKWFAEV